MLGVPQQYADPDAIKVQTVFENFLEEFNPTGLVVSDMENFYRYRIRLMVENGEDILVVNYKHLAFYDRSLAEVIRLYYYRFTQSMLNALKNIISKIDVDYLYTNGEIPREFQISIAYFSDIINVHQLRSNMIGSLVRVSGTVTRIHDRRPELVEGVFRCMLPKCGHKTGRIPQTYGYSTPSCCPNPRCPNRTDFELVVDESVFGDVQRVRLQGNEVGATSSPPLLDVVLRGRMVNSLKPGDRALITGVICSVPSVVKKVKSNISGPGGTSSVLNEMTFHTILCANFVQMQESVGSMKAYEAENERETNTTDHNNNDNPIPNQSDAPRNPDDESALSYSTTARDAPAEEMDDANHDGASSTRRLTYGDFHIPPPFPDVSAILDDTSELVVASLSQQEKEMLRYMLNDENLYQNLVASFAPFLCGMEYVKKGILLMLVGGVSKHSKEGIKLRGDINVLLVGDPATGKSQLLRYVCSFHNRGVYTSGKSASAAGLTASVVKDGNGGGFTVEAGALVLADRGVCCIDEFDKMSSLDRSAIHESMEQQTVSISKAGIQCTLNSRCSVLASMNPINGWYDTTRSVYGNVDLSLALLSRFDLVFVVAGSENTLQMDKQIATRILENNSMETASLDNINHVHSTKEAGESESGPVDDEENNLTHGGGIADVDIGDFGLGDGNDVEHLPKPPYTQRDLYNYIRFVRTLRPTITPEAQKVISVQYAKMRSINGNNTVRQLESIIRLSEAFAKLFGHNYIRESHVEEARRVMMGEESGVTAGWSNSETNGGFITLIDRGAGAGGESNGLDSESEGLTGDVVNGEEDIYAVGAGHMESQKRQSHTKKAPTTSYKIPAKLYWKYAKIAMVYIQRMMADGSSGNGPNGRRHQLEGIRQGDVVEYIYNNVIDSGRTSTQSEAEIPRTDLKRVIELVINRLIVTDNILKVTEGNEGTKEEDRLIEVHPNYLN